MPGVKIARHFRFFRMKVIEAVNRSSRDAQYLTWTDLFTLSIHRKSHHTLDAVSCLLIGIMRVCNRNLASGSYVKLKHRQRAARVFPLEQESYPQFADSDFFSGFAHLSILFLLPLG